jgi:hypothetical protein
VKIALSTLTVDPFGAQLLDIDPGRASLGATTRRVSRIATLDGGASILDGGYSVADRNISVDISGQSRETVEALRYLFQTYSTLLVLTEEGAFRAAPETLTSTRMTLLVSGIAEIKL